MYLCGAARVLTDCKTDRVQKMPSQSLEKSCLSQAALCGEGQLRGMRSNAQAVREGVNDSSLHCMEVFDVWGWVESERGRILMHS